MTVSSVSRKRVTFRINLAYFILIPASLIALLPFAWMVLSSFKTLKEIRQIPPTFVPQEFTLDNYVKVLDDPDLPLGIFYRNSAIIAVANVIQVLFTSSLFGYIFAKFEFKGKKALFWFLLSLMMIPHQMTMIPGYLILAKLGLINNLLGLIIPAAIDAFGIFLFRQFALSIPNELLDAARVDGAGEFYIYRRIVLPQLGPALATFGMLTFMFNWNAYLWPLIVLTEKNVRTLPIILTWFSNQQVDKTNLTMAASVLVILPVLFVFLLVQKWIVEGITLSGLKG
ncbi:MAG TPA: carbohydrate ABC transporter permease [Anaerolineales bacterium]|jgi:multiple sugar transport system permease protein|nr:carbohydrate ABC transporter permease [Anaerolineales bacterium]